MASYQQDDEDVGTFIDSFNQSPLQSSSSKYLLRIFIGTSFLATILFVSSISVFSQQTKTTALMTTYSSLSDSKKESLFETFKTEYLRNYIDDDEENLRYENFLAFLSLIDERNIAEVAAGGTSIHGITKFADLSQDEFEATYLGYVTPNQDNFATTTGPELKAKNGDHFAVIDYSADAAYSNDWIGESTTAVKDQGYCGSCWAFSAAQQLESDAIKAGFLSTNDTLSVQQIVSCATTEASSCKGGSTLSAYYYINSAGGIELESSYAYTAYSGTCNDKKEYKLTISDYYTLSDEEEIVQHVLTYGPVSVCLDASSWNTYTKDVLTVCGTQINHCVQAVGVNRETSHWNIRNSWGTDWGQEGGYIKMELNTNLCNIESCPTFTLPELVE